MNISFPVSIQVFEHTILLHPILEWIGIFVGMRWYAYLRKKQQSVLTGMQSMFVILGALIGALLGSKIIGSFFTEMINNNI